jgi:hypothetical protein
MESDDFVAIQQEVGSGAAVRGPYREEISKAIGSAALAQGNFARPHRPSFEGNDGPL